MLMLAISRNSFHYKYFLALRHLWSFEDIKYSSERTSLCIYTQFLFWFSILTVLISPFLLSGWLFLKTVRAFYKVCSWTPPGRKLLDFLDYFGLGKWIDELSFNMVRDPARTLFGLCVKVLLTTLITAGILVMLLGGIFYIKTVLMCIAAFFLCLALVLFYVFFGIGWMLVHICLCIKIAAIWAALFVVAHIIIIAWTAGLLAISSLVSYIFIKAITSSEKLMEFFGFKINGYHKARAENAKRREELQRIANEEAAKMKAKREELKRKKADGEVPYTIFERMINALEIAGIAFIEWCGEFFVAKTKNVKGGTYKVCTGFGVLWETLGGLYRGVCPFVEFVNENEEEDEEEDAE